MVNKDIVVIGAGPAGLSASIYLKRANADFAVIEKSMPGGKVSTATKVDNYIGIPRVNGSELAMQMYNHATSLGIDIEFDTVLDIKNIGGSLILTCENEIYNAKAIIVATGMSNKKLNIKGENEFEGRGVSYCATCDGMFFKDKPVAVIGGDEKSLNEAIYLANLCSKVYLLIKEDNLNGLDVLVKNVNEMTNIELITSCVVKEIKGNDNVTSLFYIKSDCLTEISVSGVFPLGDEVPQLSFLSSLDLAVNEHNFIEIDNNACTNIDGVFACGDITNKPLKQIITAAGDGAIAATSAIKYVKRVK